MLLLTKDLQKWMVGIFMGIYITIVVGFLLQSSISCVNKNGCLRSWCLRSWFDTEFQSIIDQYSSQC